MTSNEDKWSDQKVLMRYALLQVPGLMIVSATCILCMEAGLISKSMAYLIMGLWFIKEIAIYPFVWNAYIPSRDQHQSYLVGKKVEVVGQLSGEGYVRYGNEFWKARLEGKNLSLFKGSQARVIGQEGNTLIVQHIPKRKLSESLKLL